MNFLNSVYVKTTNTISRLANREDGVTAIEYALIAAAIAVAIAVVVKAIGTNTSAAFSAINGAV